MPTYSFKCFPEDGGCGHEFEVVMSPSTYTSEQSCPLCRKKSCVYRNYVEDGVEAQVRLSDSEIKTVGHLAGRNTEKMTDEQRERLEDKSRSHLKQRSQTGKLPPGMKRFDSTKKFERTPAERLERSKELRQLAKEKATEMKTKKRVERLENSPRPKQKPTIIQ